MRSSSPRGDPDVAVRASGAAVALALFVGCTPRAPVIQPSTWSSPDESAWRGLRAALTTERDAQPRDPWSAGLRITMRDPTSGRVVDGRGAIAVSPGRAVRMILVGAAGATVLDAWVTRDAWRVAIPPIETVRRGTLDAPREMPVDFLRWWFLTPLGGTLFAASSTGGGPMWLLREGRAVIELRKGTCPRGRLLSATRRASGRGESVEQCRAVAAPTAGDWAAYADHPGDAEGLRVDLVLDSVADHPPDPDAFVDPDRLASGT